MAELIIKLDLDDCMVIGAGLGELAIRPNTFQTQAQLLAARLANEMVKVFPAEDIKRWRDHA